MVQDRDILTMTDQQKVMLGLSAPFSMSLNQVKPTFQGHVII